MQRSIKFSKFRNLGLEKDDYLILNGDFQKGKMGNLVIIIGPNNSGKSNVLDGIAKACVDSKLNQRDVTDLYYEEKYRQPVIALSYRDDKYTFELPKTLDENPEWKVVSGDISITKPAIENIKKALKEIKTICTGFGVTMTVLIELANEIDSKTIKDDDIFDKAIKIVEKIYNLHQNNYYYQNIWNSLKNNGNELAAYYEEINGNKNKFVKDYLTQELGLKNIVPKCVIYQESSLSNSDLYTNRIEELQNHKFFNSLFQNIGVESKTIQNAYSQFNRTGNIQILRKLEKDIQKKVDKVCDRFNNLYFASNDQYKFTVGFESGRVSFGMARGKEEEPINLEYQSTGFRWFFNLFFNFLTSDKLNPGDIVIMDEPATHLHVQGQNELRNFIKEFAIKNDVLFVIATHSPFLIDVDHYDELRVISMENNRSKIDNRFAAVNLDDPDSLLPIKESLTIKQNVLYDLDTEVYFVEGITDYNYLTMFKNLLGIENIAFLPFNGVGNNSAQTKKILQRLLSVKFHKRSLLVDADKAGQDMFNQAKDAAFDSVHSLSEIKLTETKNAMMVEDLFSNEDKKKFHAISGKNSDGTSIMKDHCELSDFSETTINHFKELFKLLQE